MTTYYELPKIKKFPDKSTYDSPGFTEKYRESLESYGKFLQECHNLRRHALLSGESLIEVLDYFLGIEEEVFNKIDDYFTRGKPSDEDKRVTKEFLCEHFVREHEFDVGRHYNPDNPEDINVMHNNIPIRIEQYKRLWSEYGFDYNSLKQAIVNAAENDLRRNDVSNIKVLGVSKHEIGQETRRHIIDEFMKMVLYGDNRNRTFCEYLTNLTYNMETKLNDIIPAMDTVIFLNDIDAGIAARDFYISTGKMIADNGDPELGKIIISRAFFETEDELNASKRKVKKLQRKMMKKKNPEKIKNFANKLVEEIDKTN